MLLDDTHGLLGVDAIAPGRLADAVVLIGDNPDPQDVADGLWN